MVALSHQEVDTLSLGESSLEVHSVFSTVSAPGSTHGNQADRTDMKTLTTKGLCGPCPETPSLSTGHGPRDTKRYWRTERGTGKAIGQNTTTASNPETQTAQDDRRAQMARAASTLM